MVSGPLILSVETATLGGSVCITTGDQVLASCTGDPRVSHSNRLLHEVADCLKGANVSLNDVDLFAAASGPGSFTGLRIGIATIKALAATLERPCVGISTLRVLARSGGSSSATVALLPAGRGEMFVQLLSVSTEGIVTDLDEPAHLSPLAMIQKYGALEHLLWVGPGAKSHRELIRDRAQERGIEFKEVGTDQANEPRQGWTLAPEVAMLGEHVGALALEQFDRGEIVTPHRLAAIYVRPSDAELKCQ